MAYMQFLLRYYTGMYMILFIINGYMTIECIFLVTSVNVSKAHYLFSWACGGGGGYLRDVSLLLRAGVFTHTHTQLRLRWWETKKSKSNFVHFAT